MNEHSKKTSDDGLPEEDGGGGPGADQLQGLVIGDSLRRFDASRESREQWQLCIWREQGEVFSNQTNRAKYAVRRHLSVYAIISSKLVHL